MKPLGITLVFLGIIIFMTGNLWAVDRDGAYYYGYKWWHSSYGDDSSDMPVYYHINSSGTTDCTGEHGAIEDAFGTWQGVTTSYITFFRGSDTIDTDYGSEDGNNIIGWTTGWGGSTALAVTWMNYNASTYRITDRDIEFNDDYTWDTSGSPPAGNYDVETVALHEIGHFCGLGHSGSSSSIMFPTYSGVRTILHANDEQSISYVYFLGTDDSYEHNEYPTKAAAITSGTFSSLYLQDDDWYKISLSSGDDITVSISFTDSNGDVDMALYDPNLTFLVSSTGVTDSEVVTATDVSISGYYYIKVYGYYCDTNTYSMTITTTAAPTPTGITGTGGSSGGKVCFIATAVYDGYTNQHEITRTARMQNDTRIHTNCRFTVSPFPRFAASPDDSVTVLCKFRDEYLLTNKPGRAFVSCYERISPPIARYIEDKEPLKAVIRFYLKPVVWGARKILK